jgi:hypothetical protein
MTPARNNRIVGVQGPQAFVDESQSRSARDPNTYLLAAAVCNQTSVPSVRAEIDALRVSGARKLHWRDEDRKRRRKIAESIAGMPLVHVVVVRDGQPDEKPERRRRHCMERLLYELDTLDVDTVTFESRGPKDDKRDRDMLDALRSKKMIPSTLRIEHAIGLHEPMLWIADAICGAVVQFRTGDPTYLDTIRAHADLRMLAIE